MKQYFFIFLFSFISFASKCQDNLSLSRHSIGININSILDELLFSSEENNNQNLEIESKEKWSKLTYWNYANDGKSALRIGVGFSRKSFADSFLTPGVLTETVNNKLTYISIQIGFQKHKYFAKRINAFYGIDFIFKNELFDETYGQINTSNESIFWINNKNNFHSIGGAIPLGIEFFLTQNISISTEMMIEAFFKFQKAKYKSSSGGTFQDSVVGSEFELINFRGPVAIWINFKL